MISKHAFTYAEILSHRSLLAICKPAMTERFSSMGEMEDISCAKCTVKSLFPYFPIHLLLSKRAAFTLAEVLITLGIIGVVAAMTIPNLIQNYKRQVYSTQLKKTYNTAVNALRLSEAENGEMSLWVIPNLGNINAGLVTHKEFFDTYIKPYINCLNIKYSSDIKVYLNDGSSITFHPGSVYDIIMDINGDKKPNKGGRDVFSAYIVNNKITDFRSASSRDMLIDRCKTYAGTRDMDGYCFMLFKYDNFMFKADYPIKL